MSRLLLFFSALIAFLLPHVESVCIVKDHVYYDNSWECRRLRAEVDEELTGAVVAFISIGILVVFIVGIVSMVCCCVCCCCAAPPPQHYPAAVVVSGTHMPYGRPAQPPPVRMI